MNSYIKGFSMLELSCTLSINNYCRNTGPNTLRAGSFKFRSKPGRSSPPWSQWSYSSVCALVLHGSENAVFSTASWSQLFCTLTFFPFHLTLSFEKIPICVSLLYKSPGYHTEDVHGSYGCLSLLHITLLCQTDPSDARGGSLTEKFDVARFIVIEHSCLSSWLSHILVSHCSRRCFLIETSNSFIFVYQEVLSL